VYPVGGLSDFEIQMSDILCKVLTDPPAQVNHNDRIISASVCATPNGLRGNEDFEFVGAATKEASLLDNKSKAVSYATVGSVSLQTMEEKIIVGQTLWADWPTVHYSTDHSQAQPAFQVRGRTTPSQFLWVLRPFKWCSVLDLFQSIALDALNPKNTAAILWDIYGKASMCKNLYRIDPSLIYYDPLLMWIFFCVTEAAGKDMRDFMHHLKLNINNKDYHGLFDPSNYQLFQGSGKPVDPTKLLDGDQQGDANIAYMLLITGPMLMARYSEQLEKRIVGKAMTAADIGGKVNVALGVRSV